MLKSACRQPRKPEGLCIHTAQIISERFTLSHPTRVCLSPMLKRKPFQNKMLFHHPRLFILWTALHRSDLQSFLALRSMNLWPLCRDPHQSLRCDGFCNMHTCLLRIGLRLCNLCRTNQTMPTQVSFYQGQIQTGNSKPIIDHLCHPVLRTQQAQPQGQNTTYYIYHISG